MCLQNEVLGDARGGTDAFTRPRKNKMKDLLCVFVLVHVRPFSRNRAVTHHSIKPDHVFVGHTARSQLVAHNSQLALVMLLQEEASTLARLE